MNTKIKTAQLTHYSFLCALIVISTAFIKFQPPGSTSGGLIHLGTATMIAIGIIYDPKTCAITASTGMAIFDLLSGYAVWALPTFIIRFCMGLILGKLLHTKKIQNSLFRTTFAVIVSGLFMIFGYYISGALIYQSIAAPATAIMGDVVQMVAGGVVGIPLGFLLKKHLPVSITAN